MAGHLHGFPLALLGYNCYFSLKPQKLKVISGFQRICRKYLSVSDKKPIGQGALIFEIVFSPKKNISYKLPFQALLGGIFSVINENLS